MGLGEYYTNYIDLWKVRGTCSIHGDYIYRAKEHEESVGCPVCTVKKLKAKQICENWGEKMSDF